MVDIQSVATEIRRGKKERRRKKQDKNIMSASAMQGGHKKLNTLKHGIRSKITFLKLQKSYRVWTIMTNIVLITANINYT